MDVCQKVILIKQSQIRIKREIMISIKLIIMFLTKLRFVWNILAEMFIVFLYVRPVKNIPFKAYLSELNSLNPHDASKHNFASMQNYFIS